MTITEYQKILEENGYYKSKTFLNVSDEHIIEFESLYIYCDSVHYNKKTNIVFINGLIYTKPYFDNKCMLIFKVNFPKYFRPKFIEDILKLPRISERMLRLNKEVVTNEKKS